MVTDISSLMLHTCHRGINDVFEQGVVIRNTQILHSYDSWLIGLSHRRQNENSKVNVALGQATKAQMGSRCIALLFL